MRLTWLLVVPFFLLANPSRGLLVVGCVISVAGLVLRAAAAGSIHKNQALALGGPYAYLRHPLYLGSFLVGLGLFLAAGRWFLPPVFMGLFFWVYGRTVRTEARTLELLFGEAYRHYRSQVSAFLPRLRPYRPPGTSGPPRGTDTVSFAGFRFRLFLRNKEWRAILGTAGCFGLLWAKAVFLV